MTRFVYDRDDAVLELNAENEIVHAYILGETIDQPIERISFIHSSPRVRHVFHTDALGSIVAISDDSGTTVQDYTYSALGEIQEQSGTDMNRITYTAREALGDSLGFYYYRNRTMDPTTGRFISEDPLGFIDGPNRYVYVRNNSNGRVDPLGLAGFNASPHPIYIKPEEGTGSKKIPPQTGWKEDQDGIASPCTHPNQVFKNTNGIDLFIFPRGDILWLPSEGMGRTVPGMMIKGGWKGRDWQQKLHKKGDHGWDRLFDSSCQ